MSSPKRKLKKIVSLELKPTTPFNFDATFHKPDHFPSSDNYWQPGIRWQTWFWQNKQLGLKFINQGQVNRPKLLVEVYFHQSLNQDFLSSLTKEVEYRFNLDLCLQPFYQKFKNSPVLGSTIKRWKGMKPGHPNSLYEYLIIGVVLQNATVKRSIQMFRVLLENYGRLLEYDGQNLWSFWKPGGLKKVKEASLRSLKIGYRAKSIKRIDDYFAQEKIDELELRQQDQESQRKELLNLYGVGPATAWYLLFDVFHHYNFFDYVSPWEQKIYSKLFFNQDPDEPVSTKKLLNHFNKYRPYQQLAVHYLWEDLWWKRKTKSIPWLEKLIRQ